MTSDDDFQTLRTQLVVACAEIADLRALLGDTHRGTVDMALVVQLMGARREAKWERTRWTEAAARSDAERQRRQNSVRGTVVGREQDEFRRTFLKIRVPRAELDVSKYLTMQSRGCWIVMFEDNDGQVPKDEPIMPGLPPSVFMGDD